MTLGVRNALSTKFDLLWWGHFQPYTSDFWSPCRHFGKLLIAVKYPEYLDWWPRYSNSNLVPRTPILAILIFPVVWPRKRLTSDESISVIFHTSLEGKKFFQHGENGGIRTSRFWEIWGQIWQKVKFSNGHISPKWGPIPPVQKTFFSWPPGL